MTSTLEWHGFASADPEVRTQTRVDQIRLVYAQTPLSVVTHSLLGVIVCWLLWSHLTTIALVTWFAALMVLMVGRMVLFSYARPALDAARRPNLFLLPFLLGNLLAGAIWAALLFLIMDIDPIMQMVVLVVLFGISAGAISSQSVVFSAYCALVFPPGLTAVWLYLHHPEIMWNSIGVMGAVFLAFISVTAWRVYVGLRDKIALGHHQQSLLTALDSARARLEEELSKRTKAQEALRRFSMVLEATSDFVCMTDRERKVVFINSAGLEMTGYEKSDIEKLTLDDLVPTDQASYLVNKILTTAEEQNVWSGELPIVRSDGTEIPTSQVVLAQKNDAGAVEFYATVARDISSRIQAENDLRSTQQRLEQAVSRLERLSSMDELTGIGNRRSFDEAIRTEWNRSRRDRSPFSLILVDVDFFKRFNDELGHLEGDECLKRIAQTIQDFARRPGDHAARYGGEEFALILPGTPVEGAERLAEDIRRAVEALAVTHPDSDIAEVVTVSAGVAAVSAPRGDSFEPLVEAADRALYSAKGSGRNRVVVAQDILEA